MLRGAFGVCQADAERKRIAEALFRAAGEGDIEEVRRLLAGAADVLVKLNAGCTALHQAAEHGHEGAVRILVDAGVDVAAKDGDGMGALHHAAMRGREGMIKMLQGMGADVAAKDFFGETALDLAEKRGHQRVARVLRDTGAAGAASAPAGVAEVPVGAKSAQAGAQAASIAGAAEWYAWVEAAWIPGAQSAAEMRTEKTLDLAKMQEEKGTAAYKELSYATAAEAYCKAIRLTAMLKPPLSEEQQAATRALKLACLVHTLHLA